ncbi:MAG: UDP-3-O-(3-hydroxymyristoyl)glucosamine N-acyltransferase [Proteobacteria bacterium]|nr:UDP-3-O-(3-hydroxymyristoyl)glucosamine N-acyltransferase [Pseudomonadota bacterium]
MFSIERIAEIAGARIANADEPGIAERTRGPGVSRMAPLGSAGEADLSFFFSRHYEDELKTTRAGVILTGEAFAGPLKASGLPQWKTSVFLACAEPYQAMARLSREFSKVLSAHDHQDPRASSEIHPSSVIHDSARIGARVKIGANVVIEANAVIGDDVTLYPSVYLGPDARVGDGSVLFPGVSVYQWTVIGKRCRIHAGAVIGADGFGYAQEKDPASKLPVNHLKVYHLGRVLIGDDVEVGANSTIDRGTFGDTVIQNRVKIDNLVQIGHNVTLEEGAILCGASGVAGSATVGKYTIVGAQAGLGNQVRVGAYSTLTAYAGCRRVRRPSS